MSLICTLFMTICCTNQVNSALLHICFLDNSLVLLYFALFSFVGMVPENFQSNRHMVRKLNVAFRCSTWLKHQQQGPKYPSAWYSLICHCHQMMREQGNFQQICFLFMTLDHNIQVGRKSFETFKISRTKQLCRLILLFYKIIVYKMSVTPSSVSSWDTGQTKHHCS